MTATRRTSPRGRLRGGLAWHRSMVICSDDEQLLHVRDVTLSVDDDPTTRREKLARVILDELYEFVGLLDADGRTLEINRAALEGAGIRLDDIAGSSVLGRALVGGLEGGPRRGARDGAAAPAEGEFIRCDVEVYGRAAGSETIIVDYSLTPIRDRSGRIVFLLPEGRNITDKKRRRSRAGTQHRGTAAAARPRPSARRREEQLLRQRQPRTAHSAVADPRPDRRAARRAAPTSPRSSGATSTSSSATPSCCSSRSTPCSTSRRSTPAR